MQQLSLERQFVQLPAPNQQVQGLPSYIFFLKVSTPFCLLTLLFYLLQVFTDIRVARQVLIISAVLCSVTFLKYLHSHSEIHMKQTVVLSVLLIYSGIVMVFWQSIYWISALVIEGGFTVFALWMTYQDYKNKIMNKYQIIVVTLLFGYIYLIPLTDSGLLSIPWFLLLLPSYLFFLSITLLYSLKFLLYMKPTIFEPVIEAFNLKRFIIKDLGVFMTIFPTLVAILFKVYFPNFLVVVFLLLALSIDLIVLYFIWRFPEQICLFLWNCHFEDDQSLFRIHQRSFAKSYNNQTCNRVVDWNEDIRCLSCQNRANIVYLKCGHITVCLSCLGRLKRKKYRKCIICGIQNSFITFIYHKSEPLQYGYQRRLLVETKLMRNQYVRKKLY